MIGLFLGSTDFPKKILDKIKKQKKNYFIIDLTKNNFFKKDKNCYFISIGKFGKILKLIKEKKCKKVLFAGKIDKPKISNLKFDIKGVYYIPRIIKASKLGDAAILKELIKILAENKVKVIKSNFFNPELTLLKGDFTKNKPNKFDLINIQKGIKSLYSLNAHNHVQGLVVRNKTVIIKETSKGTKKMLQSINRIKNNGGILIKFPKKKQDLRADLPTIGLDTLKDCKKANLKGIVLKSNYNIIMDKKEKMEDNFITINLSENPIIEDIEILGIKNKSVLEKLNESISLKNRMSFTEQQLVKDKNLIKNILKTNGFYFAEVKSSIIKNDELNSIRLKIEINRGEKARIKEIVFIGDKKIKDKKLLKVIASEEHKFWKFV